jgi:hypothetical protein
MRIAIIGAGPTGIYSAKLLVENNVEVFLLEAGTRKEEDILSIDSYQFSTPSKLIPGVHKVGGGTNHWKGRISQFPKSALESVSERSLRNWPIDWPELQSAYLRMAEALGITPLLNEEQSENRHNCRSCNAKVGASLFQFIEPDSFIRLFRSIEGMKNFTLKESTFCEYIVRDEISSKLTLKCKTRNSDLYEMLEVDFVIIAGGCLQSAALVHRSFPCEIQNFPIGRYLQEHFDGYIGRLHIRRGDYKCLKNFALEFDRNLKDRDFGVGIRSAKLTKLHWHLEISPLARVYTFDPILNRFNFKKSTLTFLFNLERLVTRPLFRFTNFLNNFLGRETYSLWLKGEEIPNRDSKVYINENELIKVFYEHKVSKATRKLMFKEIRKFAMELRKNRLGRITFSPHTAVSRGVNTGANWHPLGALRMHASEERVLSSDATLIFDDRILVVDSSAFPTGAHQNPTSMAVSLADIAVRKLLVRISHSKINPEY